MYEKFKTWAWSTPTFENPIWGKIDAVIDRGLEVVFGNKVVSSLAGKTDRTIIRFEEKVRKTIDTMKEDIKNG